MRKLQKFGLFAGIFVALLIYFTADFGFENSDAKIMAAIAAWVAIWWITEAIPLAATSLLPIVLFPLFGLLSGKDIAHAYINSTILLFMGGFIIAIAMEKWDLHKRIALFLITLFGRSSSTIILGFMVASAFLSMWISNTATAVMLLPIGMAMLSKIEEEFGAENTKKFSIALMLGIAYSCSVGGIGTIIGTPPNLVFHRIYAITFPDNPEISFGRWLLFGLPLVIIMLAVVWVVLTKVVFKSDKALILDRSIVKKELTALGKMTFEEKSVFIVFILTALLWIFRKNLQIGILTIPGWSNSLPTSAFIDDGTVAIAMSIILFLIPVKSKGKKEKALLDVKVFRKIPWEIILLFGGGFALAKGFISSGLSDFIGAKFAGLQGVPTILIIAVICFTITFLTELTSNTGTAEIILPILASLSVTLDIDPKLLMIPATISASMAFMMPVATPPNAIVFGSGRIKIGEMARAGLILNLIGVVVISVYSYFILL